VDCVLLDAQEHCPLPDSIKGYESALKACGTPFVKASGGYVPSAKVIIMPACVALHPETAADVVAALKAGSFVILESGAGFATAENFAAHQEWLRECWNIRVATPVHLWKDRNDQYGHHQSGGQLAIRDSQTATRVPYVDFHWPLRLKVRDFSYVVPVSELTEHIVGWCGDWPIASKQMRTKGTLIFLGSPVGASLWAGDLEALRWLREVIGVRC
jgi:hypothetical protein